MAESPENSGEYKTILNCKTEAFGLTLNLTPDRVKLFLSLTPIADHTGAFEKIVPDEIYEQVKNILAIDRLNQDLIEEICAKAAKGEIVKDRRILRGEEAVAGRDGKLLLLVKAMNKDGGANQQVALRLIKHFDNIECEQTIGRVYHPTPGTDGIDALGAVIPAPLPKPFDLELDDSIERVAKGEESPFDLLVAKRAGYLSQEGGKLSIVDELVIEKDLDLKVGDTDFVARLTVKGSVMKGFKVVSRGNITIGGNVLGSTVISRMGDIRVAGQVFGDSTPAVMTSDSTMHWNFDRQRMPSQIVAHGVFTANSLENVSAEASGDIEIVKEIRNSVLRTRSMLKIPAGMIIGGSTYCVCGVEAKEIGREAGSPTLIYLASDVESSAEYAALTAQIKRHEDAEQLTRGYLGKYADNPEEVVKLTGSYKTKTLQLLKQLETVTTSKEKLLKERDGLMHEAHLSTTHRVNVLGTLFPGVLITAGNMTFSVDTPLKGPKTIEFLRAENRFEVHDLQPLICEFDDGTKAKEGVEGEAK